MALTGCVSFGRIDKNIKTKYIGKSIHVAIDALGYPIAERSIAGRKLYTWTTGTVMPNLVPATNGALVMSGGTQLNCTLNLEVDKNEVVTRYSMDGQLGACADFGG